MMNRLRIGIALLSLFASLTVSAQNRPVTAEEDPAAQVRALEREWLDAYEKRDVTAMERIVADDFVIYFDDGRQPVEGGHPGDAGPRRRQAFARVHDR
jgi:hypothetical protein